jgi:hypothetical protein
MENELDLLAGPLLEGGDDLPDGLVLLGVAATWQQCRAVGGRRAALAVICSLTDDPAAGQESGGIVP